MIAPQADCGDHDREDDEHERQSAVKPPRLGTHPWVEEANDLSTVVRVRAAVLGRTGVADVRLPTVADEAAPVVALERPEVLALGALPRVQVLVILEAGDAEAPAYTISGR